MLHYVLVFVVVYDMCVLFVVCFWCCLLCVGVFFALCVVLLLLSGRDLWFDMFMCVCCVCSCVCVVVRFIALFVVISLWLWSIGYCRCMCVVVRCCLCLLYVSCLPIDYCSLFWCCVLINVQLLLCLVVNRLMVYVVVDDGCRCWSLLVGCLPWIVV